MKINILTEILGEERDSDVGNKLLDTINVLWLDCDTVPEFGSKINVDLFSFIFEFTLVDKIYTYDGEDITIKLVYNKTDEVL